jgi:hypothetical protein
MGLIFSPDPFHYLFLTALVHPLSTCAYLLFLSHCNNYILPSHSRQPKLASRFILSSDWGFFLVPPFSPNLLASKLAAMHVLGRLSRKNLPRAMWSSAGLLEKGVDYKFHVREFMFRCG